MGSLRPDRVEKSTWCEPTSACRASRLRTRKGSRLSVSSLRSRISPPQASRYILPLTSVEMGSVRWLRLCACSRSLRTELAASFAKHAVYSHKYAESNNVTRFCCFHLILNLEPCFHMHFLSRTGITTIYIVSVLWHHLATGGAIGALLNCGTPLGFKWFIALCIVALCVNHTKTRVSLSLVYIEVNSVQFDCDWNRHEQTLTAFILHQNENSSTFALTVYSPPSCDYTWVTQNKVFPCLDVRKQWQLPQTIYYNDMKLFQKWQK